MLDNVARYKLLYVCIITTLLHVLYPLPTLTCCLFLMFASPLPPVVLMLQSPQSGTHFHLTFTTFPLPILSVTFLKLTASIMPSAPPNGLPKCLRFGHWLTLCTLNIHLLTVLTYLLTYCQLGWVPQHETWELLDKNFLSPCCPLCHPSCLPCHPGCPLCHPGCPLPSPSVTPSAIPVQGCPLHWSMDTDCILKKMRGIKNHAFFSWKWGKKD